MSCSSTLHEVIQNYGDGRHAQVGGSTRSLVTIYLADLGDLGLCSVPNRFELIPRRLRIHCNVHVAVFHIMNNRAGEKIAVNEKMGTYMTMCCALFWGGLSLDCCHWL
jgi:hypothetical protein